MLPKLLPDLHRGLGLITHLSRSGYAAPRPLLHRVLVSLDVLHRAPETWPDSPRLEAMPWGAGQYQAPPAAAPGCIDGPWPQPSPMDEALYAPVLHNLEGREQQQHQRDNVLRYLGQLTAITPLAAARARLGPRLQPLDDATFTALINETSLSQFICRRLDPVDGRTFATLLTGGAEYAKIDTSAVNPEHLLPDLYAARAVVLLRREAGQGFLPVAIHIGGRLLQPSDGPAWELARYFVLQGLQYLLVVVFHPRLHFPGDAIRALSRSLLPQGHVLYRVLDPFLDLTLGLHAAVIYHRRSVLHNSQRELYTPFPWTTEGIHAGVSAGRRGIPGNSAYEAYRFGESWMDPDLAYGRYRRDWHQTLTAFAAQVLRGVEPGDPWVARWAHEIHRFLPSFPDAGAIFAPGALAEAVGRFLVEGSVFHTADHHSLAAIPLTQIPWRLRRPPLAEGESAPLDLAALVRPEDHFRHLLFHPLFVVPAVLRSLRELRFPFGDGELREEVSALRKAMDELDQRWEGSPFPGSRHIATSPQY